jgi:hypothetical protein
MKNEELDLLINNSISHRPDFQLPDDFAQRVTLLVVKRAQWKTDLGEYLSLTAFLLGMLLVVAGLFYYLDKAIVIQVLAFVSAHALQVAFAIFILNFIFLVDRVLLRLLFTRWSKG